MYKLYRYDYMAFDLKPHIKYIIQLMKLIYRPLQLFARFKYPYNINQEENLAYLRKMEKAEQALEQNQNVNKIPRRKRRIYDRPRIDRNIKGYGAWRVYDHEQWIYKIHDHSMEVQLKLKIAPKSLIHAFGYGCLPLAHKRSAHREFMFMDNQWNSYLLYEYRNTTDYKPNKENYDYDNQEHLHPRQRIRKRASPEEFWESKQQFEFRVNASAYAEKFKFEKWLMSEIQRRQSMKSYDEYIDEKFSKAFTFNLPEHSQFFVPNKAMISCVTPEHFMPKKGKIPTDPKPITWAKLDEKYRIKVQKKEEAEH